MARKQNIVLKWRSDCGLSKSEAAQLLDISPQRYDYLERKASVMPKGALAVMANAWAERTERKTQEFYEWYHTTAC